MRYLVIFALLISSCKKAEDRSCFKFNGEEAEKIVLLSSFSELEINSYLVVNLIQDTSNYVVIKGGKNVINLVETGVSEDKLILTNANKCKYLRSRKKKIVVDVHFIALEKIKYQGSENVKSIGTIQGNNLKLSIAETSGTIDLNVDVEDFSLSAEPSWVDFNISGFSKIASLTVKGNAYGDTRNFLVQDRLVVISNTVGNVYVNGSTGLLKCETKGSGNVFYSNTPGNIEWNDYGTGKLLQAP